MVSEEFELIYSFLEKKLFANLSIKLNWSANTTYPFTKIEILTLKTPAE